LARSTSMLLQAENSAAVLVPSSVGTMTPTLAIAQSLIGDDRAGQPCLLLPATSFWCSCCRRPSQLRSCRASISEVDRYALLVIDDSAYVPPQRAKPQLLFDYRHRYERPLAWWKPPVSQNPARSASGTQRFFQAGVHEPWQRCNIPVVQHATFVGIKGESYRRKKSAARVSSDFQDPPMSY